MKEGMEAILSAIEKILDDSIPRTLDKISVEIHTNIGEVRRFEFDTMQDALEFIENFGFDRMFKIEDALTLFDLPEIDE